jgi:hypothetical protein
VIITMHDTKTDSYSQFLDSLRSIEKKIGKTNTIEIKIELIQIELDIFSSIDKISFHEAMDLIDKVKTLLISMETVNNTFFRMLI